MRHISPSMWLYADAIRKSHYYGGRKKNQICIFVSHLFSSFSSVGFRQFLFASRPAMSAEYLVWQSNSVLDRTAFMTPMTDMKFFRYKNSMETHFPANGKIQRHSYFPCFVRIRMSTVVNERYGWLGGLANAYLCDYNWMLCEFSYACDDDVYDDCRW